MNQILILLKATSSLEPYLEYIVRYTLVADSWAEPQKSDCSSEEKGIEGLLGKGEKGPRGLRITLTRFDSPLNILQLELYLHAMPRHAGRCETAKYHLAVGHRSDPL